jgi:hypothetical protein
MKLTQITVSYGQTQSLPEYSNVKPLISLSATIDDGDDPAEVEALLKARAKASVHEQIDDALELNGMAAKYSQEPRYQVMRTYWDSYLNRGKPELPKLVVILPNELDPDKKSLGTGLIHSGYPESRKLRKLHALRVAWDSARDLGAVLIDCADGDLTPLIAALAVVPESTSTTDDGPDNSL